MRKQRPLHYWMLLMTMLTAGFTFAQDDNALIREGNKNYSTGNYSDAEQKYLQLLQKNKDSYKGAFNLGDAYYKQGKFQEAINQFDLLAGKKSSKDTVAKAYHNLGNSYIENFKAQPKKMASDSANSEKEKMLSSGIEAYKKALINNPTDEDTRYNLAYANRLLKEQQKQNKKNKDQKKDNKDQKKDNKDKKDQEKKDSKPDKNKDQQKQQQPQLSKEDAKRLLDASNNEEKNTQEKLKKEKIQQGKKGKIEKDW